jgi:prevent-host-death family protein
MTTMAISVFKAHALEAVGRVARLREGIIITKRGKPVAQVVPYHAPEVRATPGRMRDSLVFEKDIVSPLGVGMWEAAQ